MIDAAGRAVAARRRTLAFGVAAACAAAVLAIDPHSARSLLPSCPVKLVTGLDCPGCGGLRLAHDLLRADLRSAVHDNPFLLACSPVLATLLWRSLASPTRDVVPAPVAYGLGLSALLWMAVRNVPAWPLRPTVRG